MLCCSYWRHGNLSCPTTPKHGWRTDVYTNQGQTGWSVGSGSQFACRAHHVFWAIHAWDLTDRPRSNKAFSPSPPDLAWNFSHYSNFQSASISPTTNNTACHRNEAWSMDQVSVSSLSHDGNNTHDGTTSLSTPRSYASSSYTVRSDCIVTAAMSGVFNNTPHRWLCKATCELCRMAPCSPLLLVRPTGGGKSAVRNILGLDQFDDFVDRPVSHWPIVLVLTVAEGACAVDSN